MPRPPRSLLLAVGLALFLCAHSVATVVVVQAAYNTPPGGTRAAITRTAAVTLTLPVLFPLMRYDPDGEILPRWFQAASVPLNSLVWCAAALLIIRVRRPLRPGRRGFEVSPVRTQEDAA